MEISNCSHGTARASALFALTVMLWSCSGEEPLSTDNILAGIQGRLVDARTKAPIPGAVVFVQRDSIIAQSEAVTGDDGRFEIPAANKKASTSNHAVSAATARIAVFKTGFEFKTVDLVSGSFAGTISKETPALSRAVTIEIEPFFGRDADGGPGASWYLQLSRLTLRAWRWMKSAMLGQGNQRTVTYTEAADYAWHLRRLREEMMKIYHGTNCEWKSMPYLVAAVHRQTAEFRRIGITSDLPLVDAVIPAPGKPDACRAREHFATYLASREPTRPKSPGKLVGKGGGEIIGVSIARTRE